MDALRKHANKLKEQVSKQQQVLFFIDFATNLDLLLFFSSISGSCIDSSIFSISLFITAFFLVCSFLGNVQNSIVKCKTENV